MHVIRLGWPVVLVALCLGALAAGGEPDPGSGGNLFPPASPEARKDDLFIHPLFADTAGPTPHTVRNERALFALACSYFNDRAYQLTADTLNDFLGRYPRSRQAAEARYRLALALQLQGKPEEAGRVFEELLDKHAASPFARLVLEIHLGEEQLRALALDELRRARDPDRHGRARTALDLLQVYNKRFPEGPLKREALVYRMGTCHRLLEQTSEFRSAMQSILDNAPRSDWAKLASCWLDQGEYFHKHMEEILELHADGEQLLSFLDLAEQLSPRLKEDVRSRCLFLQGRCLHLLGRDLEAEKVWSGLVRKQPRSPQAAEALFWLAEHYYERKDIARAQEAYERLLQKYPSSPHAADVKRWLAWLDDHDDAWAEAERLLAEWAGQLTEFKGGIAFRVRVQTGTGDEVRCRVAVQDRDHYRIQVALDGQRFLLASGRSGGWYHSSAESYAVHTRQGIPLAPIPYLQWKLDPATGSGALVFSTAAAAHGQTDLPHLKLPPSWAAHTTTWLQSGYHLHRETRKVAGGEERIVYRLEAAQPTDARLACWEVETDARHRLRRAHYVGSNERRERLVLHLSDVQLCEQLPADALRVDLPKGVSVQERDRVNMLELVGELCKLGGKLFESWPGAEEAAEAPATKK